MTIAHICRANVYISTSPVYASTRGESQIDKHTSGLTGRIIAGKILFIIHMRIKGNLHGTGRLEDSATYIPEGKTLTLR